MPSENFVTVYGLLLSNGVIYLMLLAGLLKSRTPKIPKVNSIPDAFQILEFWLKKAFPDLPDGFTWREAVAKASKSGAKFDLQALARIVQRYEAYRYGGSRLEGVDVDEVLKWAAVFARGASFARRA